VFRAEPARCSLTRMAFIQIIDTRTSRLEEILELDAQWAKAAAGKHRLKRQIVAVDRNDPSHQIVIGFFDSAEDAAVNSNLPETQDAAEKYFALLDAPPVFIDMDVVDDKRY
jgi:hypothetical protein